MLLENSENQVQRYILYTDNSYGNTDMMFSTSSDSLYNEVMKSAKKQNAAISKVKACLGDKDAFKDTYDKIKNKYQFRDEQIDQEIEKASRILFRKEGVNSCVYDNRITELLTHITVEILECINSKHSYVITHKEMIQCVEDITSRITNKVFIPAYSDFKKLCRIDFSSLAVASSREYLQLKACELPQILIEKHLVERNYYQSVRYGHMEINKKSCIEDIEETSYENFESVKYALKVENKDTPFGRLSRTIDSHNSYANSDQVRHGACIFLTRENERERQISWEDSDNAND